MSYITKLLVYQENTKFSHLGGRHRAAIVVTNNQIDSILIRQLSDEDTAILEVVNNKGKIFIASMILT